MKVLVCGGRDFGDEVYVFEVLKNYPITFLISGGARGVDSFAYNYAVKNNIDHKIINAEWDKYGKKAGYLRNIAMADENPDLVIAFPGGKGTSMMKKIAKERNISVKEY